MAPRASASATPRLLLKASLETRVLARIANLQAAEAGGVLTLLPVRVPRLPQLGPGCGGGSSDWSAHVQSAGELRKSHDLSPFSSGRMSLPAQWGLQIAFEACH